MATTQLKTRMPAPQGVKHLRYHYPLPLSLNRAAGLLRYKRKALEQHLKKVRREWSRI